MTAKSVYVTEWLTGNTLPGLFPALDAIQRRLAPSRAWTEQEMKQALRVLGGNIMLIRDNLGALVGFSIFRFKDNAMHIRHYAVDPEQLDQQYISAYFMQRLKEYGKQMGKTAFEFDEEEVEHHPSVRKRKTRPATLLENMQYKLTEMTGMEWMIATENAKGHLEEINGPPDAKDTSYYLTLRAKVKDPQAAQAAVCAYFGRSVRNEERDSVIIPASWVRQFHVTAAKPDQLIEDFIPAKSGSRYRFEKHHNTVFQGDVRGEPPAR